MENERKRQRLQAAVNQTLAKTVHFGRFYDFKIFISEFSNYEALKLHIDLPKLHIYSFCQDKRINKKRQKSFVITENTSNFAEKFSDGYIGKDAVGSTERSVPAAGQVYRVDC